MEKQTFKGALYHNLPFLQEYEETKIESKKLLHNIEDLITLSPFNKYYKMSKKVWGEIVNYIYDRKTTDVFLNKPPSLHQQGGSSNYYYIYDLEKREYVHIYSNEGIRLMNKYLIHLYKNHIRLS